MIQRRISTADNLIDFHWRRHSAGYRISATVTGDEFLVSNKSTKGRFLVPAISDCEPQRIITYVPLVEKTGLFKHFAETSPSEEGILKFANEYGCLGGRVSTAFHVNGGRLCNAEPLTAWRYSIHAMSEMLLIWEAARESNLDQLSSRVFWNGSAAVFYKTPDNFEVIASDKTDAVFNPELLKTFTTGDIIQPAMCLLQRRINLQLMEHGVSAKLLWSPEGRLVIRLSANSLIGALWLQFARAVEGNKNYQQCQNCHDWIEVGGNRTARSDKKFCSPSCKSAAHRRLKLRQKEKRED